MTATSERTPPAAPRSPRSPAAEHRPHVRIQPGSRGVDPAELWRYRDLLYYLVRRDVLVRYVQTVLGLGWAILQPLVTMVVFTVFFGRLAQVGSDGVPYALFSLAALVPWTYFSSGLNAASISVVQSGYMITRVYFPRIFVVLTPLVASLVDFLIAFALLIAVLLSFGYVPQPEAAALPLLVLLLLAATLGLGLLLASLGSRYRDVRYAAPFLVQLLLFVSPVIYSVSVVPEPARYVYALNPMVGVIEGFRSALLGTVPFPWELVGIGALSAGLFLAVGVAVFSRTARHFADLA